MQARKLKKKKREKKITPYLRKKKDKKDDSLEIIYEIFHMLFTEREHYKKHLKAANSILLTRHK